MDSATELSLAFIDKHPIAAGRTLSGMEAETAAAFLDTIPTRAAAKVLSHLGAWPGASIVMRMDRSGAAAALRQLPSGEAVAILRLIRDAARASIMDELPKGLRREFEASLSYPEGTVGAHMTTAIVALDRRHTVGDVRQQLARAPEAEADVIFVADAERRFVGAVSAAVLLRRAEDIGLGDILDQTIECLAPRARLSAVAGFKAWEDYPYLPVVDRQRRLLGALSRRTLQRETANAPEQTGADGSIAASITESFMSSVWELAGLLVQEQPQRAGREVDHER